MQLRSAAPAVLFAAALLACSPLGDTKEAVRGSGSADGAVLSDSTPLGRSDLASVVERGGDLYRRGEYDSMRAILSPAVELARARDDSEAEGRILTILSLTAYRESDYDEARSFGTRSLDVKLAAGLTGQLWSSYNVLGLIAMDQARYPSAVEYFDRAAETVGERAEPDERAVLAINHGLNYAYLGNFTPARTALETGLELSRLIRDTTRAHRLEGVALLNLGMLKIWIGDPAEGVDHVSEALPLLRSVDAVYAELNALGQLGTAYTALGEIGSAIAALDSALQLARKRGIRDEESSNLEALAEAYRMAGDQRRALGMYEEAERINAEIGLVEELGADRRSRAEIFATLGDLELALELAEEALATHRSIESPWEVLRDLILLTDITDDIGDNAGASRHLAAARAMLPAMDARTARVDVALAEARNANRNGRWRRVLRVLSEGRDDLESGGYDIEWEAEMLRARASWQLGQLDSARAAGRRAVAAVERTRGSFGSGALRTAYMADRLEAYSTLATILIHSDSVDQAFVVADAARGRALLEHLAIGRSRAYGGKDAAAAFEEGEELLRRVNELTLLLGDLDKLPPDERDSLTIGDVSRQLTAAREQYEAARLRAIERDAARSTLLGGRTPSASEIRAALRDDEVLLEYLVTAERLLNFVVTRKGSVVFERSIPEDDIVRRVRHARDLMSDPDADPTTRDKVLGSLYGILLKQPLASDLAANARRLIVVPHGVLTYLPFATLRAPGSGRYVVEDYDLQVLPSAAALPALRDQRRQPSTSSGSIGGIAFAPLDRTLPATREEALTFRRTWPGARFARGRRATESRLRRALAEVQIVHVATHGIMNTRHPMFSRIELAGGAAESTNDGRLEVHELLRLRVASPLVFLSGCETGLGPSWSTGFARGEDYATLAQAFLYAGAANVIATLWPVEDRGAAVFAKSFYEGLVQSDPVDALARAQRSMLKHPRYRAPYYWAPYQVLGEGLRKLGAQESGARVVSWGNGSLLPFDGGLGPW